MYLIFTLGFLLTSNCVGGQAETFTEAEENALQRFQEVIKDKIVHDYEEDKSFLIRWLRAKQMDVNKAADMFHVAQIWRKENNIDTIGNETILEFNPVPVIRPGYDKEGNPIVILSPTHIDLRRILIQGMRDKLKRYWFQVFERSFTQTRVASKTFGKSITRVTVIMDLHGYNLRQHFCLSCISVLREVFIAFEKYYPEFLRHLVIINLPRIGRPLIDILRPLFSPSTDKALALFPPDRALWSAFLLKIASPDQLPYQVGGTRREKSVAQIGKVALCIKFKNTKVYSGRTTFGQHLCRQC